MRQLQVQVREDRAPRVIELANEFGAFSPTAVAAQRGDGQPWAIVFLNLPNRRVGEFVEAVEDEVEDAQFVLIPRGSIPVQTPLSEVQRGVRYVTTRSTMELVLDSLQSIGTWKGLVTYAAFSGVVGAYGVIFDTSYLLTAAMLIAPMGAPAMVCAIGTAVGDWRMFGRGALRFFAALLILALSAVALGYAYRLRVSTTTMEQIASLSGWAVMLSLVGGAAGASSQAQSDRDSLVTGTATGFLVAVALSPPTAVLGLSIAIARWDYVGQMAFLLALTFTGIITGGWIALSFYGVRPAKTRAREGSNAVRTILAAVAGVLVVGMVWWQSQQTPLFRKADLSRDAVALAREAATGVPYARLLEASAHFTRTDRPERQEALLLNVIMERGPEAPPRRAVEAIVREMVTRRIESVYPGVIPYVNITVLSEHSARAGTDEP